MASFLDTLTSAAEKAVDTAKAGISIANQEQKVYRAYLALGKLYYRNAKNGNPLTGPAFDSLVAEISAAQTSISKAKNGDLVDPEEFEQV